MGVVYYANYLRWFEMGRTELLRQIGAPYSEVEKRGLFFPVTEVSCRYLRSARFDDLATTFDAVAYGGRPADPPDLETARREWPRVVAESRSG